MGKILNDLLSIPSTYIPFFTPHIILVGISILFGYFYGRKDVKLKYFNMILFSILFYGFMRWIGVGE